MPINFTDFSQIAPQRMPDFLGEAMRGYQAGRMPHALRQEEEKNRLANALKELEYQYKPQEYEEEILSKQLGNQGKRNELAVQPEMLALALKDAQRGTNLGESYDEKLLKAKLDFLNRKNVEQPGGASSRSHLLNLSQSWRSTPTNAKMQELAIAQGLGIPTPDYIDLRNQGLSQQEIFERNGIAPQDVENVIPRNVPTGPAITAEIRKNQALAEVGTIEDHVKKATAPYAQKIKGHSPALIWDALKGESPDKIARFAAARAIQPELASLRIRAAGGNIGHGAIEEIVRSALGKSELPEYLMTPEIYEKMQTYINDWIQQGAQASSRALYHGNQTNREAPSNDISQMSLEEIEAELGNG